MKTVNIDDVLKILHKYGAYVFITDNKRYAEMQDEIANIPSVQPKTGHWIYKQYGGNPEQGNYHCSECDNIDNRTPAYCPHCGCHMVDLQEKSEKK